MSHDNMIYETDRLYVRPFVESDIHGNYRRWWTDADVTKYNSHGLFPYTENQMKAFLKRLESTSDIVWAVILKEEDVHIGNISLQSINTINRSAEFACVFGEKWHWGKGYCTESAMLLFYHGFNRLNLNRIWTGTAATNGSMMRVAEKLGMTKEGSFRDGTYLDGNYVDVVAYGILRSEWDKLNKGGR